MDESDDETADAGAAAQPRSARRIGGAAWAVIGGLGVVIAGLVVALFVSGGDDGSGKSTGKAASDRHTTTTSGIGPTGTGSDPEPGNHAGGATGAGSGPSSNGSPSGSTGGSTSTTTSSTTAPPTTVTTDPKRPWIVDFSVPDHVTCVNTTGTVELSARIELERTVEWILRTPLTYKNKSITSGSAFTGTLVLAVGCEKNSETVTLVVAGLTPPEVTQTRTVMIRHSGVAG